MKVTTCRITNFESVAISIFVAIILLVGTAVGVMTHWVFGLASAAGIWSLIHFWARK